MDYFDKKKFHANIKKRLLFVAKAMGLQRGQFDIRTNIGGDGILGETILHTDTVYVMVGGSLNDPNDKDQQFMYRTCKHRKDFTGGQNHWISIGVLDNPDKFAETLLNIGPRQQLYIKDE